jgi:predicted phage tail component-like protein
MASSIKSFAGVNTPAYLIVERVTFSVLPQSRMKSLSIPMKSGEYFISKEYGIRVFTADVSIKAPTAGGVMYNADDFAEWLHTEAPAELIFRDKPDITYYAIVDNSIDLVKFGQIGKGQINFVCFDPHGYGQERTFSFAPLNTDPISITNGGNATAHPYMEMTFSKNVTDFAILSDNDMLYFGEPFDASINTSGNQNPRVLYDALTTVTGWTPGITVDDGTVQGTLYSTGNTFKQTGNNYGTGVKWHGGSLMKSLPNEIQDFTVEVLINMGKAVNNMLGRIECYLLDVNLNKIGKLAYQDASSTIYNPTFKAVAGPQATGKVIVNSPSGYLRIGKKAPVNVRDIYGWLKLTRKGKKYTASCYVDVSGKRYLINEVSWTDTKNLYNKKLAAIQLHISAHGNSPAVGSMSINSLNVYEHKTKVTNEIDYVFRTGDKLSIDNATGEIRKNGEEIYSELYPSSSFIKLEKGVNGISVSDPAVINGTIKFKERWL